VNSKITQTLAKYAMTMHDMASVRQNDEAATLTVKICDAGAGPYVVVSAREWSFDDLADAEQTFELIREAIRACEKAEVEA
jgi:hypothetical protein